MKRALLLLWQLPQLLLGLLVAIVVRARLDATGVWWTHARIGVSFGPIVIIWHGVRGTQQANQTVSHERGHSRQSEILGLLYLVVVGIPSLTFNLLTRAGAVSPETYYARWPENWADRLGNVMREERTPI